MQRGSRIKIHCSSVNIDCSEYMEEERLVRVFLGVYYFLYKILFRNTIKNHVSYVFNYKERLVFVFLGGYYFLRISCINIDCSRHGRWKAGSCVFGCEYCFYKIYIENTIKNRESYVYVIFVQGWENEIRRLKDLASSDRVLRHVEWSSNCMAYKNLLSRWTFNETCTYLVLSE